MAESWALAPVWFTDVLGSGLMVVMSFATVLYARKLYRAQPENVIWTYLLWLSIALAGFAMSRGVGHIAKRFLLIAGMQEVWVDIRPFSGSINTLAFALVASVTLFFQQVQKINRTILNDKQALEAAGKEVMHLNRNLESLVRQRTEELSRSEQKYRRIFEGSMDMIFILEADRRFADINRAGMAVLGYGSRDEVRGRVKFCELFASQEDCDQFVSTLASDGFVTNRQCRLRRTDGAEIFILVSATARKDEAGKVLSYEGIAKDVTARLEMERQLQQADRLASLGQISTGIAHEVNNPLGVMLGYTQLLLRDNPPGNQIHDDLKVIEKHARNCKNVVEDLLKFARGTITHKQSIDVNQCVGEVVSLLTHQFGSDQVSLLVNPDLSLPPIIADGEKLKQVFMNLLMNAKQAIAGPGVISVKTGPGSAEGMVRVTITDTGSGISPEHVDKIFDPFFSTKPVGEGTGLGLSVSYGIIQDHQGRIEVESRLDRGSTFSVLLPIGPINREQGALSPEP